MPTRWFYNLFATDGFINLPTDPTGTEPRAKIYVWGFVGGLYKKQRITSLGDPVEPEVIVNPQFDISVAANLDALRGTAVIPSPRIDLDVGDELYITLVNLGMYLMPTPLFDVHTIHIHGGHVVTQLDGVPEVGLGVPVTPPGEKAISVTYYFKPEHPGTFFYHCHQEASEHIQMGMYGALIVYPSYQSLANAGIVKRKERWYLKGRPQPQIPGSATNRNFAYNDIYTYYDSDWVMLFSDIDSRWHEAVYTGGDFNPVDYRPNYWLVNGRAFPDTLLPTSLPAELTPDYGYSIPAGYETFVHVAGGDRRHFLRPDKFLLRLSNIGYQPVPFHVHGWHGLIVGKDTHPLIANMANPAHMMNFTTLVGSGESYDLLYTAEDKRDIYAHYLFCGKSGLPSLQDQVLAATEQAKAAGTFIPPYPGALNLWTKMILAGGLGKGDYLPPYNWAVWDYGAPEAKGLTYPQFYIAHNHDDYKVTNNGVYPGGQLVIIQTDYPGSDYTADPPVITEPVHFCK